MLTKRKYEIYVNEQKLNVISDVNINTRPGNLTVIHHDHRDNQETPHFIEIDLKFGARKFGDKITIVTSDDPIEFPKPIYQPVITRYSFVKHPFQEIYFFMGIDPDHPEDLGGTIEVWLGKEDKAEPYIFNKPTAIVIPPNVFHGPTVVRELRKTCLWFVVLDSPCWSGVTGAKTPPVLLKDGPVDYEAYQNKKYKDYITGLNIKDWAVNPSHKGKVSPMVFLDRRNHDEVSHFISCQLIYKSGVGFGIGEPLEFPTYPHKHPWYETYSFAGIDPDHPRELGGTVEFWIGEGDEAEQYIITKPTTILIPKHTVHHPIYFREVNSPILMATVLDAPLWAGMWIEKFSTGFKKALSITDIAPTLP